MVNTAINREREMRVAVERVVGFAQEFGEAHLNLACHAAFPLSLTPDLLYQIWANFVPEAPWTAVARVLLSRLCQQVGSEMYEMDNAVRNLLLRELKVQFGQERFDCLGEFLLEYVSQRLTENDSDTQDLRQAQEWTALAYTKPEQAARELAQVLSNKVQQEDIGEVLRLSSLVETLSEPLVEAGFEPLLIYGQGVKSYVCGDLATAKKQIDTIQITNNTISLAGINLNIPQILSGESSQTHYEQNLTQSSSELSRNDDFYIERPPIEQMCFDVISKTGSFIRIKAPHQMGKTLLLNKILDYGEKQNHKTVYLNFQLAENSIFADFKKFLKWFCASVTQKLKLPNRIDEYWHEHLGLSMNCTRYFEDYILTELETSLVLGIDEIGQLLKNLDIAENFLSMLRSWHEQTKMLTKFKKDNWHKLKLVFTYSLELNMLQNIAASPLTNVGVSVVLPEFSLKQVTNLAKKYRLKFNQQQINRIILILGGHPYLTNCLFEAIDYTRPQIGRKIIDTEETIRQTAESNIFLKPALRTKYISLEDILGNILKLATTDAGIYSSHLQQQLLNLQEYPELLEAFKEVLSSPQPIKLAPKVSFQLEATGLVKIQENLVVVRNKLYFEYFRTKLVLSEIANKTSEQKSIDYTKLENLLAAKRWKEADLETANIFLTVSNREEQEWLGVEDIKNLSCKTLIEIDRLWLKHSNSYFGLSTQKQIWENLQNEKERYELWWNFGQIIGWRKKDKWLQYDKLLFSLDAPQGHLPCFRLIIGMKKTGVVHSMHQLNRFSSLMSRFKECER